MIKLLRYSVLFLFSLFIAQKSYAQFPYKESFRNTSAANILFGGSPTAYLTAVGNGVDQPDPPGDGYLRLTSAGFNQKGYAIGTTNFPSINGLSVMFEYNIYGGGGADGITFFLFDAAATPFTIGGFGGSLGYAQIAVNTPVVTPGVSKGYLAIGLDEYGNFSNPIEARQGGPGFKPGSITLRGSGDGNSTSPANYRYLTSVQMPSTFPLVGNGGARQPDEASPGFRRVFMDLAPNVNGGFNVTVKITRGGTPTVTETIIDRFYYPDLAPVNLRYGFASSTGDVTNIHEIRNVEINAYTPAGLTTPTAVNDVLNVCQGSPAIIDVAANDATTNAGGTLNRSAIDLDPNTLGLQTTFTLPNQGTFSLTSAGSVQFTPIATFLGTASSSYTIQDSFALTSNVATITVNVSAPPTQPNAGPDELVNISSPTAIYVLNGNSPGVNAGVWTQVSGPAGAVITSPSVANTTVTNLTGGTYVFRWSFSSAGGCTLSDDVQIIINHRPVAVNDEFATGLNTDVPIAILTNDTDADGNATIDKASIVIKSQPTHGTLVIDNVTGVVTYKPFNGYSGMDSFVYTIKDNFGVESNTAIVNIAVNVRPVGADDTATTPTNTPVVIRPLDNDPGKTGSTPIKTTDPLHGAVTFNADGTVTYTPTAGYSGKDTFTYKLINGNGLESDPITVTVNVKPVGSADNATTPANTPIIIPIKDNDAGRTGTTVMIITPPLTGTTTLNTAGVVTYTPVNGFVGKDTFTYTLTTADGLVSDPIIATINVKPLGSPDAVTTNTNVAIPIPVKDNDLTKSGTTVVIQTNPLRGAVSTGTDGTVNYTPNTGYSGRDSFTYILRTADGVDSDPITAGIVVKPVGSPDNVTTPINTPISISVKDNDLSRTGTLATITTGPGHGTVTVDALGVMRYTPTAGYAGTDTYAYTLTTADGISSDPIAVTITISSPIVTPDLTVVGTSGRPVTIPVTVPTGGRVTIVRQPLHGTVTIDPTTGLPIYTPNPNYSGPDDFTYTITDANGNTSVAPGTVSVTVALPAKIGLAKSLVTSIKNTDGSYDLTYLFTLVNNGDIAVQRVSLTDDLAAAFPGCKISVTRLNASGILFTNPLYNGTSVREMLLNTSNVLAKSKEQLILQINVIVGDKDGTFNNTAFTTGVSASDGSVISDNSTDGVNPDPNVAGDYSPANPTPVQLIRNELFIPKGFSPNGDGINDLFVIENSSGKQILLEVFNRWGNRIFRSADYKNTWNGKTTEGVYIGDDVPVGTYYYVVVADNNKYVGYITINR